ncbi:Mnd1 family-domain-containing protein [Paraphoma chrysanthemicola]|nr:Mnd1 family-domain-containing protein [Paraphoma chrysanthemicola]
MDETALIAFGILLEETAREELGETGDLAFTEAADEEEERALAGELGEDDDSDSPEAGKGKQREGSCARAMIVMKDGAPKGRTAVGYISPPANTFFASLKTSAPHGYNSSVLLDQVVPSFLTPASSNPQRRKARTEDLTTTASTCKSLHLSAQSSHYKFQRTPYTYLEVMAPKIQPNPQKAATILAWFHKTAQAHSVKDLEKTLPQVGAISGMHVKDYLQALADDNKIRVEKIGSGNWYWSFPSDEKKAKDAALEKAQDEFDKVNATVMELQAKVDQAGAARAEDEDVLTETEVGGDRKTLIAKHTELAKELEKLRTELAAYSEQDPVEVEKKAAETQKARDEAEKFTDQIYSMEGWIKTQCAGDKEAITNVLKMLYDDEYDEEEGGLREL